MTVSQNKKLFLVSALFHVILLFILVLGFDFTQPLPVIENTNKNDVISAVVLGESEKSKLITKKLFTPPSAPQPREQKIQPVATEAKVISKPKPVEVIKKDVIAIKTAFKKFEQKNDLDEKMRRDLLAKDMLAEINKQTNKQKKLQQKKLQEQFAKTFQEQTEKSLRQQLLNEEIKLQGTEVRESQGEINKYKALILQAISQQWIIPTQANKKLYCELLIRVAPGGMVLDVQITKTSGDPSLDSSARSAVLKASPLPVPADSTAFEAFRQFELKVKPENILEG